MALGRFTSAVKNLRPAFAVGGCFPGLVERDLEALRRGGDQYNGQLCLDSSSWTKGDLAYRRLKTSPARSTGVDEQA